MATLAYVFGAVVILIAVGWLIGQEIARASVETAECQTVVLPDPLHKALRAAFGRLDLQSHTPQFTEDTSVHDASCMLNVVGDTIMCRPVFPSVESYALRGSSVQRLGTEQAWERSAFLIEIHGNSENGLPVRLLGQDFERVYDLAWRHLATGLVDDLPVAHRNLRLSLADWPVDRIEERVGALANMAFVCARLQVSEVARLARRLEGYDAACEALRLQYEVDECVGAIGLRALMRALQQEIVGASETSVGRSSWPLLKPRCPQTI